MDDKNRAEEDKVFVNRMVEAAIRISLVVLLVGWCFLIVRAFIAPVLWGIVIAVGVQPLHQKLAVVLGNRERLTATLLTLFALAFLITPTVMLTDSTIGGIQALSKNLEEGSLTVPPPPDTVETWPVIGKPVDRFWRLASTNIDAATRKVEPQIKKYGAKVLSAVADLGIALIQFLIAIIIAGVMLANTESGYRTAHAVFRRLAGERGDELADLSAATIRSVVQGVLGIAIIQAVLAGAGMMAVNVPAAGLWTLMVLFLAVIQLSPLLVLGPIIFYVFSVADTTPAVIFMVWSILVSGSDTFLKPMLLGRGVEVPMLVILLGAIGGLLWAGLIGLFVGAVVLALGYNIFYAWVHGDPVPVQEAGFVERVNPADDDRK